MALSNADKQAAYRVRQKAKLSDLSEFAIGKSSVTPTDLRRAFVTQKFLEFVSGLDYSELGFLSKKLDVVLKGDLL
jgi:hypothetical protein